MKNVMPVYALAFLALIGGVLGTSCSSRKDQDPPRMKAFKVKFDQVREGMTEKDVDAIFGPYNGDPIEMSRDKTFNGKPLVRPSTKLRIYADTDHNDMTEGDYCINIYFDYWGVVVGKDFGEFTK
jgi:hypothetical protein